METPDIDARREKERQRSRAYRAANLEAIRQRQKEARRRERALAHPCVNEDGEPAFRFGLCRACLAARKPSCGHDAPVHALELCERCYVTRRGYKHKIAPAMWLAYVGDAPTCDLCGATEPGHFKGWSIDHAKGHACHSGKWAFRFGCQECVRANLCFRCNRTEGNVRVAVEAGLMDPPTGPIAVLFGPIEDTPFQRWLASR